MVRDTPPSQDVSTHQIWNSYLKEYRRYGPDTKAGRTHGRIHGRTVRLLYASQSSFGGIIKLEIGVGEYCFWCRYCLCLCSLLSRGGGGGGGRSYLLNQLVYFFSCTSVRDFSFFCPYEKILSHIPRTVSTREKDKNQIAALWPHIDL